MATILSRSSPSPTAEDDDNNNIPTATLALPATASATATISRRLPPPCWSPEETVALIDAYRDKWYSLRRGNLRANHWKEVAEDVASRFPVSPQKTAVQCRHKMEKLRKRYRSEIQRAAAHGGVRRYASSWAHFLHMHSMEKGPNPTPPSSSDEEEEEEESDHKNSFNRGISRGFPESNGAASVRIKIPGRVNPGPSLAQNPNNPNPRFINSAYCEFSRDGFNAKDEMRKKILKIDRDKNSGLCELAAAIHSLGDGFMRMEKVKMDMVRQVEEMRMEMELKRTEMILESERRILEAFAQAITEKTAKRAKRNSPES
ncbi:hypothetical protein OROGR_028293 [Orobanche gracilis]